MSLRGGQEMRALSLDAPGFRQLHPDMLQLCLRAFQVMVLGQQALLVFLQPDMAAVSIVFLRPGLQAAA